METGTQPLAWLKHLIPWSLVLTMGCHVCAPVVRPMPDESVPSELRKIVLPPYVIEPPDILLVQVYVPPDNIYFKAQDSGPERRNFSHPLTPQPVDGQHLVRMDGTINLGIYGSVLVAGLTLDQARERIRGFVLEETKRKPDQIQVNVDVIGYNSKNYYIIADNAGYGEQLHSFPTLGNETVLDAMARIGGLPQVASKRDIWIARRSPNGGPDQILPVCWEEITQQGVANSNWQVLPGDRIYVKAQKVISLDNALAKVLQPINRILGVTLLAGTTVQTLSGRNLQNQGF